MIYASKEVFEIIEYMDGNESGFATRVKPKTSEPLSGIMFSTVTGKKC